MVTKRLFSTETLAGRIVVLLLAIALVVQGVAKACGPEKVEPIFVFTNSPDLPFAEFAKGNIGVIQPTFGRKTLVIAHRYLGGGSFTTDEQVGLVEALKGKAPEADDNSAINGWIKAREQILSDEVQPPAIYDERRHSGYDFFPNCTKNAFEVATETLKDRVASYGAEDPNVRDWVHAQDVVFRNCAEGAEAPSTAGSGSPHWLQKDRDYQIAAAFFYSLNFKEARSRFEKIAEDSDSVWQEVAAYLVGRTLVREASLETNKKEQVSLYQQAEATLTNVMARGGKFQNASKRLLGLVKYRLRPEERVVELAQILDRESGNDNIRQDLIDYTWLLDKFDQQVQDAEEERKKALEPTPSPSPYASDPNYQRRYDAIQRGELVEIYFSPKDAAGEPDYLHTLEFEFKPDVKETEVLAQVEIKLGRKLSTAESDDIKERYALAMSRRQFLMSPNRKWTNESEYEGCEARCNELSLSSFPPFLRADELSDWILTLQSEDAAAFNHSYGRWRETRSPAWLVVVLIKAQKSTPSLPRLLREGDRIDPQSPAFPTIAYQMIRLNLETNNKKGAKEVFDKISTQLDSLPVSSQNLFSEQRLASADSLAEFLKFAGRKPAAFYEYGSIGRVSDLLRTQKAFWNPEYISEPKEEYDRRLDEEFKDLLPWDERKAFADSTTDILNWHFPVALLLQASRDPVLPNYLRRAIALTVWTRAVLIKKEDIAHDAGLDLVQLFPELSSTMKEYLAAATSEQRSDEALFIILKYPNLSPWVPAGIPEFSTAEKSNYYFESSWWCRPSDTEYRLDGTEVPKVVSTPSFLDARTLASAKEERTELVAMGDAKAFLGKRVLSWATRNPNDPRIPEAAYIGAKANENYKYGCGGNWEQDEETRTALETLLREKYPNSPWTAKLDATDGGR